MNIMSHEECLRECKELKKSPNQILLDWVQNVKDTANSAEYYLDDSEAFSKEVIVAELRSAISNILGQCTTMITVLKNSN